MSVPACMEFLFNSGVPDEAPRFHCCYCGGTFVATEADVVAACGAAAEDGALDLADSEAFRLYGRDVCDAHLSQFQREQIERRTPLTEREWILVQGAYATGRQDGQAGAPHRVDRLYQRAS